MLLIKKASVLNNYLEEEVKKGKTTGFVPTMGALHEGHLALIKTSKSENDICICSIFVNPTQFNDPADFKKYPVTIEQDIKMLEEAGCDLFFLPQVSEIYPAGTDFSRHYELGYLETILEGKYRPGHFQGVCMVVHRLLDIVAPQQLYLGQKDYQQCMVIEKLITLIHQAEKIKINICPTLREPDGLAMSSRNRRLNEAQREKAPAIFQALQQIKNKVGSKPPEVLKEEAVTELIHKGFSVDYIEIADASTLSPVSEWQTNQQLVLLAAAFLDDIRLIDNITTGS